jgi:radical SAM protein with 4Fe4S-binding SPASM domain
MPTFDNKARAAAARGSDAAAWVGCASDANELAVAPSGRLYPCARLVGEDRDTRLSIGDVYSGVDSSKLAALARGPADEACEPCAERWRCAGFCVCANVAETQTTDKPGGVQCWHEQTTARIADEFGHALLAERSTTFVARTYGGLTAARRLPIAR